MAGGELEIVVGAQEGQFVANAELRKHSIDRAHLNTCAPAFVSQLCRPYIVLAVRLKNRQCLEALDDLCTGFRA